MTFATAASAATFAMAAATTIEAGDRLEVVAPAELHGIADLVWTLAGLL